MTCPKWPRLYLGYTRMSSNSVLKSQRTRALAHLAVKGLDPTTGHSGPHHLYGDQIRMPKGLPDHVKGSSNGPATILRWAACQPLRFTHHLTQGTPVYMGCNLRYTCEQNLSAI